MTRITREEIGEGFYTYAFLGTHGSPYYIGKGCGGRAWDGKSSGGRRPPRDASRILILKKDLAEEEAFRHEIYMISVLGRKDLGKGILRNLTDGGEGISGRILDEETKIKIGEAQRGEKNHRHGKSLSEEHKRKMSESLRGREFSEEHRRKIGEATRNRSTEMRAKVSAAMPRGQNHHFFGKKHSAEARKKMSDALRGRRLSEEHRKKISDRNAKTYVFTDPFGKEFVFRGGFNTFCREQGLAPSTMWMALRRNCSPPPRSGWLVRYASQELAAAPCKPGA
jgi:hypothetical protein